MLSALCPLTVPSTHVPLCPQDTRSRSRAAHLGGACLVRSLQAISLPCPLLLVQKAWKLSPKAELQIAPPSLWLVKNIINPFAGLLSLQDSVGYEHTHKYIFHYGEDNLKCGRQKGLIALLQAGDTGEKGKHELSSPCLPWSNFGPPPCNPSRSATDLLLLSD